VNRVDPTGMRFTYRYRDGSICGAGDNCRVIQVNPSIDFTATNDGTGGVAIRPDLSVEIRYPAGTERPEIRINDDWTVKVNWPAGTWWPAGSWDSFWMPEWVGAPARPPSYGGGPTMGAGEAWRGKGDILVRLLRRLPPWLADKVRKDSAMSLVAGTCAAGFCERKKPIDYGAALSWCWDAARGEYSILFADSDGRVDLAVLRCAGECSRFGASPDYSTYCLGGMCNGN